MVTPSDRFVKRFPVSVHVIGKAFGLATLRTSVPAATAFVFFQMICHFFIPFLQVGNLFVFSSVSPFHVPVRVVRLGHRDRWDTTGHLGQLEQAVASFLYSTNQILYVHRNKIADVPCVPPRPMRPEQSRVSSLSTGIKVGQSGHSCRFFVSCLTVSFHRGL